MTKKCFFDPKNKIIIDLIDDRELSLFCAMPPFKHRNDSNSESFMLCEAEVDDLRKIYCRIGDRYFELSDRESLSHREIVERIKI